MVSKKMRNKSRYSNRKIILCDIICRLAEIGIIMRPGVPQEIHELRLVMD
jgi:hypothetical protein